MGRRVAWLLAGALVTLAGCAPGGRTPSTATQPPRVAKVEAVTANSSSDELGDRGLAGPQPVDPPAAWLAPGAVLAKADPTGAVTPVVAVEPLLPAWVRAYHGAAHVWMPTLGVSRQVWVFPCSRGRSPDNLVYRWGCAGTNNVYLLGHAWGVFQALHDAYYNGKLKVGMPVIYADARGKVRLYRVTKWQVVSPVKVAWAIASQPVPSLTLQTCIGTGGQLRLNVRLVEAFK